MAANASWIRPVRSASCMLAGVVSAWTTRRGISSSQVFGEVNHVARPVHGVLGPGTGPRSHKVTPPGHLGRGPASGASARGCRPARRPARQHCRHRPPACPARSAAPTRGAARPPPATLPRPPGRPHGPRRIAARSHRSRPGRHRPHAWEGCQAGACPRSGGRSARASPIMRWRAANQVQRRRWRSAPPAASRLPVPAGSGSAPQRARACCPCAGDRVP